MTNLLEKAGASFLRAFGAALLVLAPGIFSAPDLQGAKLLAVAALFAALTAGFKALQVFVPALTFGAYIPQPFGAWVDSFVRAFLGTFLFAVTGWLSAPDLSTWKAALTAALVGALAAAFRAVQGVATKGEVPAPNSGLPNGNPTPNPGA